MRPTDARTGATAVSALVLISVLAGCSSTTPSTARGSSTGAGTSVPATGATTATASTPVNQIESNPPGDIPDNQAFVPYSTSTFAVSVPEGWARQAQGNAVVFSDKYNSITVETISASAAPTPASATTDEVPGIAAHASGYVAGKLSTVQRAAGSAVLITYQAYSPVNPVTGKVAKEAVERYEFWRSGQEVILTLAAPVGSDNVDPWRKVTDSFAWH